MKTANFSYIGLASVGFILVLPLLLSLSSKPALAQSDGYVDKICGAARDAADYARNTWADFQSGSKTRENYNYAHQDFSKKKQLCLTAKGKLYAGVAVGAAVNKKIRGYIKERIPHYLITKFLHPSYLSADGLGQLLEREGPQMKRHWHSIREAIDNVDNLTPEERRQKKGALDFLKNEEKKSIKRGIKEIKRLSSLINNGIVAGSERRKTFRDIEKIKYNINNIFVIHGKDPLFIQPKHSSGGRNNPPPKKPASTRYKALCAVSTPGTKMFVWDARGRRYGCQDRRLGSKNFSARKTPIIVGVPGNTGGKKIDCPVASWPGEMRRVQCPKNILYSPKRGRCAVYSRSGRSNKYCYYVE